MTAARFLARRTLFAVVIIFLVSSGSLVLTRLAPGDVVIDRLGPSEGAPAERLREQYGLTRSLPAQYADWLAHAARLDFGRSLVYDRPVSDLVPERAKNTALLAFTALVLATVVGLPLGVVTGSRGGALSGGVRALSVLLLSMPPLLTSLLLVFIAARTGWLPLGGMRAADSDGGVLDVARHMIVPVTALALPIAALFERLESQAIADIRRQPFYLAGAARGGSRQRLLWRDALKASLGPIASVYGIVIGSLLSGSFAVEIISAWPGLGRLMFDALKARDSYLVAACAAAGSVFLAIGTLAADVAHAAIDPRIRE